MAWFNNLKVKAKMIIGFLTVTSFSVILACVGVVSTTSTHDRYAYLIDSPIEQSTNLRGMQLEFMTMRYRAANYVMNSGDEAFINSTALVQYQAAYANFLNHLNEYMEINSD